MECDKEKTVEQGKEGGRERGRRLWRQILPGFATLALAIVFSFIALTLFWARSGEWPPF